VQVSVDNHAEILNQIDLILEELLHGVRASRVTLRQDVPGDYAFPVTHEALADGVASLRGERTVDLRAQPVVRELAGGHQVVQDDCRSAYDEPAFLAMLETYGGLAAQIVTPVLANGALTAIVSVHQLGAARPWSDGEVEACTDAAHRIGRLL